MNYFELHIGDYLKDTAHLSLLEHGIYTRLLEVYYIRESAIPADDAARLIGARARDEKAAMVAVLKEFFELREGAWHQDRCEREIANYHERMADRDDAREGEKERQRRARERRKEAFELLRSHGIVAPWNASGKEIEALLSRVTGPEVSRDAKPPVTPPVTRDNTASHLPSPISQTPELGIQGRASATAVARPNPEIPNPEQPEPEGPPPPAPHPPPPTPPSPAALASKALRQAGVRSNPSDPRLVALCEQGVTPEEFAAVGAEAAAKGVTALQWVITAIEGRRSRAAAIALDPPAPPQRFGRPDPERANPAPSAEETSQLLAEQAAHRAAAQSPESQAARIAAMAKLAIRRSA